MRLVTFGQGDRIGIGALAEGDSVVVPFAADPSLPSTMREFVCLGSEGLARARTLVETGPRLAVGEVRLLAPIRPANNVMCVGKNYHEHAKEFAGSGFDASQKQVIPDHPVIFTKATSCLAGPGAGIPASADETGSTDYEAELAVVIGRPGTKIARERAWDHVYGYTAFNDATIRDLQKRHIQFFIGKSAQGYGPMGPCLVTRDEMPAPEEILVEGLVNGQVRQSSTLDHLIFSVPELIEAISAAVHLEPGDVIATGTPAGVGIGFDPPVFLAPGDEVSVRITGVGTLTNPVV